MKYKLFVVAGPGGRCLATLEQANSLVNRPGFENLGELDPRTGNPIPPEGSKTESKPKTIRRKRGRPKKQKD